MLLVGAFQNVASYQVNTAKQLIRSRKSFAAFRAISRKLWSAPSKGSN